MGVLREYSSDFYFQPILPGNRWGSRINFRGWIENLSDNSDASWTENRDMGRADPKYIYSEYSRTINVDFRTAALNEDEEFTWIEAINSLKDLTKPFYNDIHGYNGVMCSMKIGDLINEIGIVQSVSSTVVSEGDWINNIPMIFDIGVQFKVVGAVRPEYRSGGDFGVDRRYGLGIASQ